MRKIYWCFWAVSHRILFARVTERALRREESFFVVARTLRTTKRREKGIWWQVTTVRHSAVARHYQDQHMRERYHGRKAGMRRLPWQRIPHHRRQRNATGGELQQRNNEKAGVISRIGNVIFLVFEPEDWCASIICVYA